jgi:hypothetical protein
MRDGIAAALAALAPTPGSAPASPEPAPAPAPRPRPSRRRIPRAALAAAALVSLAAAALTLALPLAAGGDATAAAAPPAPIAPRDGRWRGDPAAGTPWETELQRLDETRFAYRNINRLTGHGLAGTLTLERLPDGSSVLSGRWADLPTCPTCTNVGFIELIVLDETALYQNRGTWGPSHDDYRGAWPPYRYRWQGALRDAAHP